MLMVVASTNGKVPEEAMPINSTTTHTGAKLCANHKPAKLNAVNNVLIKINGRRAPRVSESQPNNAGANTFTICGKAITTEISSALNPKRSRYNEKYGVKAPRYAK